MSNDWVYDIETYPNVFTIAFEHASGPFKAAFEISEFRNDSGKLMEFLNYLHSSFARMVGFNNVGFDYPVLHQFIRAGRGDASTLYQKAMAIIESQDKMDRWSHGVKPTDRFIPQLDLYLIHHFDNNARATSLKILEFNMRSESIQDLPFPVGTMLTREQVEVLKKYNAHDAAQTRKFYHHSKSMIAFREELTEKYHRDFLNHNDTKIGKDYFVMELEKAGVSCYDYAPSKGRTPRQTPRPVIHLRDAILPWIHFQQPEFNRVLNWLKEQSITETKGVFKDITATVDGFQFVFGTGGIHGSLSSEIVESDEEYMILDLDVTSYYPNLAIQNGFYPEHLGQSFVHIYNSLFEQRKQYPKKSAESSMLKLALNGVYGDSGNPYSVFYDPLFTMRITLNGQLLLCLLAERLMDLSSLRMLQINTDGLTVRLHRSDEYLLRKICEQWSTQTRMNLESVEYTKMCIRDCNNYLAVSITGSVKRKGAYEWQAGGWYDSGYNGWNQNASALVVPKVVEKVLVEGAPIRKTIEEWPDVMDFMLRTKVPRSSHLLWGDERVQNVTRYLVTTDGKPLTKMMPPLGGVDKKGKPRDQWRPIGIESGWNVHICNNLTDLGILAVAGKFPRINYDYYVCEVEKLVMGLK